MATISMLEARFKIKYQDLLKEKLKKKADNFKLSVRHVLKCSYYNQGCDGGYSYLVSKFFKEFELYPEQCFSDDSNCKQKECSDPEFKNLKFTVDDYYYVGGSYGATNEFNLMKELYENGPIVVSMEPNYLFMSYNKGVFDYEEAKTWKMLNSDKPQWQKVDHSVVLVGWKEEMYNGKMMKFWILQNSWGAGWGEKGYMRFKRGEDLMGIESIGETAIPNLTVLNK
jgi:cathepsin C